MLTGCNSFHIVLPDITPTYDYLNAYFFNHYSSEEQSVYNKIYTALYNEQTAVDLDNCTLSSERIFQIATQVSNDHPEFFYFYGDTSYHYVDYYFYNDNTLTLKYAYSDEEIAKYKLELEALQATYLEATKDLNLVELLDYTYDYLIDLCTYDQETLETIPEILDKPNPYGIIGALIDHNCVCAGYAKAFQYLLNLHNIECLYIEGYLDESRHAWNVVNINGSYYHFDITSDDIDDPAFPATFYQFYGLNTTQILQTHIIDSFVEETNDSSYNYHILHNHYITSIDELDAIITPQASNEVVSIQCSSYELYQEVIYKLIEQKLFSEYMHTNSVKYICDGAIFLIQFYTK